MCPVPRARVPARPPPLHGGAGAGVGRGCGRARAGEDDGAREHGPNGVAMSGARLGRRARVLVRLPAWLGDFVMSEPIVRALEAWLEDGTLTLCARAEHLALFEGRFPRARRMPVERGRE